MRERAHREDAPFHLRLLYWIAEKFGAAVWLDSTRSSATKLVRSELDKFMLQCEPVRKLAIAPPPHPGAKKWWTTLTKCFRGKQFRIIGSGAEHGIGNERDRLRTSIDRDSASWDKIVARTKLFVSSRLLLDNSTPGEGGELSPTWQDFLARSQRYCYLPCPHCSQAEREASAAKKVEESEHVDHAQGENGKVERARAHPPDGEHQTDQSWQPLSWDDVEPGRSPLSYEPCGDGDTTKEVYEVCPNNREIFSPYKGGDWSKTRGSPIRISPIMDNQIDLIWAVSDFFAHKLYFDCIKNGATMSGRRTSTSTTASN